MLGATEGEVHPYYYYFLAIRQAGRLAGGNMLPSYTPPRQTIATLRGLAAFPLQSHTIPRERCGFYLPEL
jgi:hypothetical protein